MSIKSCRRGLLPPRASTLSPAASERRDAQLFDAVWSSVIEGLGRNGQPERANKAFEEMLEQLSADAAAVAQKLAKSTGWRGRQSFVPSRRDPRLFDAYLRAGLPHPFLFLHHLIVIFVFYSAASAQFLFPHVLDIFDTMNSHRCAPSEHTYDHIVTFPFCVCFGNVDLVQNLID
jgi:pentatricopeptide repeat protein